MTHYGNIWMKVDISRNAAREGSGRGREVVITLGLCVVCSVVGWGNSSRGMICARV